MHSTTTFAPLTLPATPLSSLFPLPFLPFSVLTLLLPFGRPLLNAVLSSGSPHVALVQTAPLRPFRQPDGLAFLVFGCWSHFDDFISLWLMP